MKPKSVLIICLLVQIFSCSKKEDSRVEKGYPFGDNVELNTSIFEHCTYNHEYNWPSNLYDKENKTLISNRKSCDSLLKLAGSKCDCSSIDFSKKSIAFLSGFVENSSEVEFKSRVYINHKNHTYTIELRALSVVYKDNFVFHYSPINYFYSKLIVVPKPPSNYTIITGYWPPVYRQP